MNIIEVKDLKKSYDNKTYVLKNVSFNVKKGEIFGLLGPNGAGKTTTVNILTTALNFQEGKVKIDGLDLKKKKSEIRKFISISSQNIAIDYLLTVEDNLKIFAGLYGLNSKVSRNLINKFLKDFNLQHQRYKKAMELSGGQLRRLQIIRSLLKNSKILFLDEPTLGLDPIGKVRFLKYLKHFKESGVTIFLATNEMNEAEILCDRIAFINKGKVFDIQSVEEFIKKHANEMMIEITLSKKEDANKLKNFIKKLDFETYIYNEAPFTFSIKYDETIINKLIKFMDQNKITFENLKKRKTNLNDAFIKIVKGEMYD